MKIKPEDIPYNLQALLEIVGCEKFIEISKLYGGDNIYIPTYQSTTRNQRNRDILKRYNGTNAMQLAREYNITANQIRKIISS